MVFLFLSLDREHIFNIVSCIGPTKAGLEYQRISIDRSKLSEDEAFEHAIDMISSRQMGFRKAADFFQVSKWKLYKTARKRGIYAEIKKQNQAHVRFVLYIFLKILTHSVPDEYLHFQCVYKFMDTRNRFKNQSIFISAASNFWRKYVKDFPQRLRFQELINSFCL